MFASSRRIETCIAWPWKVKVKIWPQVKVTTWPKLHFSRSVLTRQTHWDHFHVSSSSQSQVICKNLLVTSVTSDDLSGATGQHLTLGHHEWPKSTWSWKNYTLLMRWEGFQYFPPLTHNGEVRILTWPQVIDVSKIRDIQIVGTSGLIKFWKLEKILLRTVAVARAYTFLEVRSRDSTWWPDLMWPRHKISQQM